MPYNTQDIAGFCTQYLDVFNTGIHYSFIASVAAMLISLATQVGYNTQMEISEFCTRYLDVFNTGIHYSFLASIAAMLISLVIFIMTKKGLPSPAKKAAVEDKSYTPEEKAAMSKEIKQRMGALFAVEISI